MVGDKLSLTVCVQTKDVWRWRVFTSVCVSVEQCVCGLCCTHYFWLLDADVVSWHWPPQHCLLMLTAGFTTEHRDSIAALVRSPPSPGCCRTWSTPVQEVWPRHSKLELQRCPWAVAEGGWAAAAPHICCTSRCPFHHLHDGCTIIHTACKHGEAVQRGTGGNNACRTAAAARGVASQWIADHRWRSRLLVFAELQHACCCCCCILSTCWSCLARC